MGGSGSPNSDMSFMQFIDIYDIYDINDINDINATYYITECCLDPNLVLSLAMSMYSRVLICLYSGHSLCTFTFLVQGHPSNAPPF